MPFKYYISILSLLLVFPVSGILSQTSPDNFVPLSAIEEGLAAPLRLAIDGLDNIYVTDVANECIRKYDPSGTLVATLAHGSYPVSVAVNANNELFYGDGETGFIYNLGAGGQKQVFYEGTGYPSSMVFSPENTLYVADNSQKKVLAINVSGDLMTTIGDGELVFPTGLAYDVKNGRILVAEHGGLGDNVSGSGMFGRGPLVEVHMFDLEGNETGSFGSYGNWSGKFYRLQGMTVGRCGNIYICEPFQGNINVFSGEGTYITKFGEYGTGDGQLSLPMDIAFNSQGQVVISCHNKGTLEIFTIDDPLPSARIVTTYAAACEGFQADIIIELTGTPPWSLTYVFNGQDPVTIDDIYASPYALAMLEEGKFEITGVSDANAIGTCITGSATVNLHPEPTASLRNTTFGLCEGRLVEVPVFFTGEGPWTLTFAREGSDPVTINTVHNPLFLQITTPGSYELLSVSCNDCEGSIINSNFIVDLIPAPTATFTCGNAEVSRCQNDPPDIIEVALTGTPPWTFTYTVDDMGPTGVVTSSSPYFMVADQPGTYEIISVSDLVCTEGIASGYPDVVIHPEPTAYIPVDAIGLCPTTVNHFPIHFTGTPPWTFSVQRFGSPEVFTTTSESPYLYPVSQIGTYTVTSLEDLYCIGAPVGISVEVNIAQPPTATLPQEDIILCEGQDAIIPITFSGTSPWVFTYVLGNSDPVTQESSDNIFQLSVNMPGLFQIIALTDGNCDARHLPDPLPVVQYPTPLASFSYIANDLEVSFSNSSSNADTFLWEFGDNSTSPEMNPVHNYAAPGNYTVTLEASNVTCGSVSYSQVITVTSLKDLTAGGKLTPGGTELELKTFPNPSDGHFVMELRGPCHGDILLEVISLTGQVLMSSMLRTAADPVNNGMISHELDLSGYGQGVYLLKVRCNGRQLTELITVTRR